MGAIVLEGSVRIPPDIDDLDSFCHWACSDTGLEHARYAFLNGEIWIEMSPEQIFHHNQPKGEFAIVLGGLAKTGRLGRFYHDRMLLRNDAANLSTEPDGAFASRRTLKSKRVRVIPIAAGYDVLLGTPDMVLEIVSKTSEVKDYEKLRELYWRAGIPEYWLVDPRSEPLRFDILKYSTKGYVATRKQSGWARSEVFNKSFRLTVAKDELGDP